MPRFHCCVFGETKWRGTCSVMRNSLLPLKLGDELGSVGFTKPWKTPNWGTRFGEMTPPGGSIRDELNSVLSIPGGGGTKKLARKGDANDRLSTAPLSS